MMQELQKQKEDVFQNPNLCWLDFAVGTGMVLASAYDRLMAGLAEFLPDRDARHEHICTKMLTAQDSCFLGREIFKLTSPIAQHDDIVRPHGIRIAPRALDEQGMDCGDVAENRKFDIIASVPIHSRPSVQAILSHRFVCQLISKQMLADNGHAVLLMTMKWMLHTSKPPQEGTPARVRPLTPGAAATKAAAEEKAAALAAVSVSTFLVGEQLYRFGL